MLDKRNISAGRAGRAPEGRDERRVVSCEGKMKSRRHSVSTHSRNEEETS